VRHWVNGKTTLDEEIQALEALDGVSYMTLM
jgi:putative Mg2+ transporter-C (MgtC) family protein